MTPFGEHARAQDGADDPVRAFAAVLAAESDPSARAALVTRAQMIAMNAATDGALTASALGPFTAPLAFDFEAEPPAPDWAVVGVVERGTVVHLDGDTGAAKSIMQSSLVSDCLAGCDWLGHETRVHRVSVVDEENPERLVRERLAALGTPGEQLHRLAYFSRAGAQIGDGGAADAGLRERLASFRPCLLIIDTLMAACAVEDANSNAEAVRVMGALRQLAKEHNCGVIILHHERKRSKDHAAFGSGQATLGARQWVGQADGQMTITVETDLIAEATDDGEHLRRTFRWRPAEKDRDGRVNLTHRVAVDSEKDERGRLLWMTVHDEGVIEKATTETDALARSIGSFVQAADEPVKRAEIAAAVGRDSKDSTFDRALKAAVSVAFVQSGGYGKYAAGDEPVSAE